MNKNILCFFLLVWMCSCNVETKFETKIIKNLYSIEIPEYMEETNELNSNANASLQYKRPSSSREIYVLVIHDDKTMLGDSTFELKTYADFSLDEIKQSVSDIKVSEYRELEINGLKAIQTEVTGKFNGAGIFYLVTIIESKSHFYQMFNWTLEENAERYKPDIFRMINSFQEIKK